MIEKRPEIVESDSTENVGHSVDITVSNAVEKPLDEMVQQRSPDGLGDAEYDAGTQSLPSITTRSEAQPAFENALNDDEISAAGDDKIIMQETVDPTINDSIEQRLAAAGPSSSNADSRLIEIDHRPAPFARSSIQQTVEKPSKKRPLKGSPDDYPQILLHNAQTESAPSVGKRSLNVRIGR